MAEGDAIIIGKEKQEGHLDACPSKNDPDPEKSGFYWFTYPGDDADKIISKIPNRKENVDDVHRIIVQKIRGEFDASNYAQDNFDFGHIDPKGTGLDLRLGDFQGERRWALDHVFAKDKLHIFLFKEYAQDYDSKLQKFANDVLGYNIDNITNVNKTEDVKKFINNINASVSKINQYVTTIKEACATAATFKNAIKDKASTLNGDNGVGCVESLLSLLSNGDDTSTSSAMNTVTQIFSMEKKVIDGFLANRSKFTKLLLNENDNLTWTLTIKGTPGPTVHEFMKELISDTAKLTPLYLAYIKSGIESDRGKGINGWGLVNDKALSTANLREHLDQISWQNFPSVTGNQNLDTINYSLDAIKQWFTQNPANRTFTATSTNDPLASIIGDIITPPTTSGDDPDKHKDGKGKHGTGTTDNDQGWKDAIAQLATENKHHNQSIDDKISDLSDKISHTSSLDHTNNQQPNQPIQPPNLGNMPFGGNGPQPFTGNTGTFPQGSGGHEGFEQADEHHIDHKDDHKDDGKDDKEHKDDVFPTDDGTDSKNGTDNKNQPKVDDSKVTGQVVNDDGVVEHHDGTAVRDDATATHRDHIKHDNITAVHHEVGGSPEDVVVGGQKYHFDDPATAKLVTLLSQNHNGTYLNPTEAISQAGFHVASNTEHIGDRQEDTNIKGGDFVVQNNGGKQGVLLDKDHVLVNGSVEKFSDNHDFRGPKDGVFRLRKATPATT